jgi:hypothetical protein
LDGTRQEATEQAAMPAQQTMPMFTYFCEVGRVALKMMQMWGDHEEDLPD